jgi:hypothetical protein
MRYDEPSTFPFGLVSALMQWFGDEERQLAVLRRAIEAWRAAPDHRFGHRFVSVFQSAWKALPPEEAREVAQEIVQVTRMPAVAGDLHRVSGVFIVLAAIFASRLAVTIASRMSTLVLLLVSHIHSAGSGAGRRTLVQTPFSSGCGMPGWHGATLSNKQEG